MVESVSINVRPGRIHPGRFELTPDITGGTNDYEVAFEGAGLAAEGSVITGVEPGRYTVRVTDRFLGRTGRVEVHVEASLQGEMTPFGDTFGSFVVVNAGDLNADGFDDVLLGSSEADLVAGNGGGVFIYHSDGLGGLQSEPVQSLGGVQRNDEFGRSVVVADINGDEISDLLIGARLADIGAGDIGAAYIHLGQPDGTFSEAPVKVLTGVRGGDQAGFSVTACDFNGDERVDIALAAILYEDRDADAVRTNQGGILIFLGYEDGLLDEPDQIVLGREWVNGEWVGDRDLQLGTVMDAGDIDLDGYCDLVVGLIATL